MAGRDNRGRGRGRGMGYRRLTRFCCVRVGLRWKVGDRMVVVVMRMIFGGKRDRGQQHGRDFCRVLVHSWLDHVTLFVVVPLGLEQ